MFPDSQKFLNNHVISHIAFRRLFSGKVLEYYQFGDQIEFLLHIDHLITCSFVKVKSQRMEIKFGISGMLKPQKDNSKKEKSAGTKTSTLKRKWSLKLPKLDRKDNSNITNIETKTASDRSDDNRFNNSNNKLDYEEEVVKETSNDKNPGVKHHRPWVAKKESWEIEPEENYNFQAKSFHNEDLTDRYYDEDIGTTSHSDFQEVYQVLHCSCVHKQ